MRSLKAYEMRVAILYEGTGPKPRIHRLRRWLLRCIGDGPPPINQGGRLGKKQNRVSYVVTCMLPGGRQS